MLSAIVTTPVRSHGGFLYRYPLREKGFTASRPTLREGANKGNGSSSSAQGRNPIGQRDSGMRLGAVSEAGTVTSQIRLCTANRFPGELEGNKKGKM